MKLLKSVLVAMLLGIMAIQAVWADINDDFLNEVKSCKLDKVKQLVRFGADVNAYNGESLVYVAQKRAYDMAVVCLDVAKYLISQGLDINAEYFDTTTRKVNGTVGYNALLEATKNNFELAKYLISQGVDMNADVKRYNLSNIIGGNGCTEEVRGFTNLDECNKQKMDLMEYAISKGIIVTAKDVKEIYNWYVDYNKYANNRDNYKNTFIKSISVKVRGLTELAIKNAKNLNECDGNRHILTYIVAEGDEASELLLKKGLDVNSQCDDGTTMLMEVGLDEVKYLISKGADVNIRNKRGETALTKALNDKNYDLAEFLISKGAKK